MAHVIKKILARYLYIALVFGLFILACEFTVRLFPGLHTDGMCRSKNKRLVYELYPGYKIKSLNAVISSQGMNDRFFSVIKPKGTYRIAVVGDSTSFGWRVPRADSFPKTIEDALNHKDKRYEVINFSVPGYNTAQEYELIKEKVIKFNPDVIMLFFDRNDLYICNMFRPNITALNYLYNRSYFVHFLLFRVDNLLSRLGLADNFYVSYILRAFKKNVLGMFYYDQRIYVSPGLEIAKFSCLEPPEATANVPFRYRYMVGYENYRLTLSKISTLLKRNNIKFISSGFFTDKALEINNELGIEYVFDLNKAFNKPNSDLTIPGDGHLNEKGHRLLGEDIYNFITAKQLFD